jgi:dolichyl-phosphate-mannose-protein mannosyltransferase
MSSTPSTLRQRGVGAKAKTPTKECSTKSVQNDALDILAKGNVSSAASQWDYKVALAVITVMAFATRFYGISHPNEVVFDEVHFGKVSRAQLSPVLLGRKTEEKRSENQAAPDS